MAFLTFAGIVSSLHAQPATTTVSDTIYNAVGPTFCSGTITLSWTTFYSSDGYLIQGGKSAPIPVSSSGHFSVNVVPTNTVTTPPSGIYTAEYTLTPPSLCAQAVEFWNVPSSSSPVNLLAVRTVSTPPPSLIPVTSLVPPPTGATVPLCFFGGFIQWSTACETTGGGTVVSVGVALPSIFSVTGSPVTTSGVITAALANQTQNLFFASPNGSTGLPAFRAIAAADLPALTSGSSILSGNGTGGFSNVTIGTGLSFSSGILSASGSSGTVTSVALSLPSSLFSISGSPVTTSGTLAGAFVNQNANLVFAGPSSGSAAAPAFRSLVTADLPTINFSFLSGSASCGQLPALTGDTTTSAGSCATTTSKINGTAFPASAHVIGSNSSSQPVAATAHDPAAIRVCTSSSGSGTTYTCTTSPSFTPAAGDEILWQPDDANTGSATLNVNSAGAKTLKKQSGTVSLAANDICASPAQYLATYDGASWEVQGQLCSSPGGGGASRGVFASRPSCGTSGSDYYSTDVSLISECNGSSWLDWYQGMPVILPSAVSFTWQNQGSAAVTTNGVMSMTAPSGSGDNIRGQEISLPSTPFTIDACFLADWFGGTSTSGGLYMTDGTKVVSFQLHSTSSAVNEIEVSKWTSVTSFSADYQSATVGSGYGGQPYCLRWYDDGTNVHLYTSKDLQTWNAIISEARTNFLTPTEIGWFVDNNGATSSLAATLTLVSWNQCSGSTCVP